MILNNIDQLIYIYWALHSIVLLQLCVYIVIMNYFMNKKMFVLNQMFQYITDDGTLNAYIDIHYHRKAPLFIFFLRHCQMFNIPINTQRKPNGMEM